MSASASHDPHFGAPTGTFNLWIDSEEHPDALEPGVRQRWGQFQLGGEPCVLTSEGPILVATLRAGAADPHPLFRVPLALPRTRRRHLITLGWSKGRMKVLLDSKVVTEVPITFLLWLTSVCGVLWSHWS